MVGGLLGLISVSMVWASEEDEGLRALSTLPADALPVATSTAPAWWPWTEDPKLAQPPEVKPYQMPTLAGDGVSFKAPPAPVVKAVALDADAIFERLMACYPEKSPFKIDVRLRASVKSSSLFE